MNNRISELAREYRQTLNASNNAREATLLFTERYFEELSEFNLDEQEKFIRIAGADPRWWISLNGQWQSPVKLENS